MDDENSKAFYNAANDLTRKIEQDKKEATRIIIIGIAFVLILTIIYAFV